MINGKNAQQKILSLLSSVEEPITVETIARQTNLSEHTVRKTLTDLKKPNLVSETNAYWIATPEGKELYNTNPYFGSFSTQGSAERRENWAELLGPEVVNNALGRHILQGPLKQDFEKMLPSLRYLVLAWLVGEGITVEFNALEEVQPTTALESRVIDIFQQLDKELEI